MPRLDTERQKELEPKRMEYAIEKIKPLIDSGIIEYDTWVEFIFKGHKIKFFPYSGWHSGKSIVDGRGLQKLLNQLKTQTNEKDNIN